MEKKEIREVIVKAGLNLVPGIGGALASILEDYLSQRKEVRLKEFLNDFLNDMKQRNDNIVQDYVNSEEFLDVFENILSDIIKTRSKQKRQMLKNLLVNSCTIQKTSYEKTEEFQHLIDVINLTGLLILSAFYKLQDIYMDSEEKNINKIWDEIKIQTGIMEESTLLDYIGELESRSLVESFRNNYYSIECGVSFYGERPYITKKGIEFYKYIISQN